MTHSQWSLAPRQGLSYLFRVLPLLQFPDLPSLKSESAIRQSVGFLRTAKHVIKDGKDQMAPLIESDENRELFQKLAQAISNIPGTGTMAIAEK